MNSAALLARMNFALGLVNNKIFGTNFDMGRLSGNSVSPASDSDPYQVQLALEQVLLEGEVSGQTHTTIEKRVTTPSAESGGTSPNRVNVVAALLLGSPEFQRH